MLDFSIPSGYQTVWFQIKPDKTSVCKGYQQIPKVAPSGQRVLNIKQLVDTTFCYFIWLQPFPFD